LSCHTTPQGQPVAPGAQAANVAQFLQAMFEQVQLCPVFETCEPTLNNKQLD
jgi:hypothetical protein